MECIISRKRKKQKRQTLGNGKKQKKGSEKEHSK
jgi:hypothetical protein